ncbi:restriction endonuclease [Halorhodospira halophila]|uniref:restriction endonuclease n=1 Tax=Halorhodospira halophila TaxID=1053 RepID=UPI001F5E22C9|nr:restriction endonuclease [Halorhodospira halophila]
MNTDETTGWMVRAATGGRLADEFWDKAVVAIGWEELGDLSTLGTKEAVLAKAREIHPEAPEGRIKTAVSQQLRFRDEVAAGDRVVTYDSGRRQYHVGTIAGPYQHDPERIPPCEHVRAVEWEGSVSRDDLSQPARNTLGSTLTLFRLPPEVLSEIEHLLHGEQVPAMEGALQDAEAEEDELARLQRYRQEAFEIVKDRVIRLGHEEMEELVAGLLRAMGYRASLSPQGPDRGVDVLASPDGFGFESPRIVAQVKHRPKSTIGAAEIRDFLGGRHADDKGLYVSTGGFTREAQYEAERAKIPLFLMDLNGLVQTLMEHYEGADADTRTLLPLTRLYWPL